MKTIDGIKTKNIPKDKPLATRKEEITSGFESQIEAAWNFPSKNHPSQKETFGMPTTPSKKTTSPFTYPDTTINDNYFSSKHYNTRDSFHFTIDRESLVSPAKRKWPVLKVALILVGLLLVAALAYVTYFTLKARSVSNKINFENRTNSLSSDVKSIVAPLVLGQERKKLLGETEGRINILLLGAAGETQPGKNLTDTLMIMSIDTKNKKVGLLSLPRDLYVNIPNTKKYTKINSLYQIGLNENQGISLIKSSIESIVQLPIHYYFVVDFHGFEKVIDDLGGINVEVMRDIYDARYPGPNYSYETFELKKGWQQLDGKTALKYVRERHDDPEGDFGRAKRQQQVLQTVKNKAFSLGTILNAVKLNDLLNNLEKNIKTNVAFDEIESFLALSKEVDTQNISNKVVDAWKKDSLLKVSHVFYGSTRAFVLVPRAGNFSDVAELAKNIFTQEETENRLRMIESEKSYLEIRNETDIQGLAARIRDFLDGRTKIEKTKLTTSDQERKQTEIIDCTNGKKIFSLNELVTKIPAKLVSDPLIIAENCINEELKDPADLVLLLGKDVSRHYMMEENSIEELDNSEQDQEIKIFE